jgi:dynein heavy chain, axonemal
MESDSPMELSVPGDVGRRVTDFQKLILIKVMREEKVITSITEYVRKNLGQEFIDIPPLDLTRAYKDTSIITPLVFILSSGSDPIAGLLKLAAGKDINMLDRLHMISLGQGQGPIAEDLIKKATKNGDWVFLQNCHLAASWMGRLETIIKEFQSSESDINQGFRLFLSSMPSKVFPTSVLQDSVKITNEPPKGLRANIARSFADITTDLFDVHPPQGVKFKKLLFGLSFFNAIIHERKKFGPLGWNIPYDWSNSDLEVSIIMLKNILQESKQIPWDALLYLTGEITFGGRVTDEWDRRTLKSILNRFYSVQILDDTYKFSPSGLYFAPPDADLAAYRAYIESLPFNEDPSIFGMHENANISFQLQEARRLIKIVLDVQPRLITTGGGKSPEDIVIDIASSILSTLPEPLVIGYSDGILEKRDKEDEHSRYQIIEQMFQKDESGRLINSLTTVLVQEAARFNKLLNRVRDTLENLIKAVKGLVVMSADLELVFKSILNSEVK